MWGHPAFARSGFVDPLPRYRSATAQGCRAYNNGQTGKVRMGFPFDPYPAKPETIDGYADTLVRNSTDVHGVDVDVLKKKAHAAESVDGDLKNLLDEPFDGIGKDSKQVSLASAFAAGQLYRWSKAITTFNGGVTKLNDEYAQQKAKSFGVPDAPAGPSGGYSPGALEERHDKAVKHEESLLLADLKRRWGKLDDALDTEAETINKELDRGPTKENVLALFASGALPQKAFPLLKALGLDPKKIASVLADLRTYLDGSNGNGPRSPEAMKAWFRMLETLRGMNPDAAAVILGALSDDELKALDREIGDASSHMKDASDFYSFILAGATTDQVTRLKDLWKANLRPDGGENWAVPGGRLFNPPYVKPGNNNGTFIGAGQGSMDDCWMLAKLNALVGADPNWPQDHVRDNGNGTVSVQFYDDDGHPYWVTVTDELPDNGASPEGPNSSTWAAYYEKAMAADDHGRPGSGYDSLTAGLSDSSDVYMAGQDSDNLKQGHWPWSDDPYDAVVKAHNEGKGVVAENWANAWFSGGDDDMHQWHVYYVKDIQADGDVVLGNPWGDEDVVLSPSEFNDYMEDVSIVHQ